MFAFSRAAGSSVTYVRSETLGRFFVASTATPADSPIAEMVATQPQQQQQRRCQQSPSADPNRWFGHRVERSGSTPDHQTAQQQLQPRTRAASFGSSRCCVFAAERPKQQLQMQPSARRQPNQQQRICQSPPPSGCFVTVGQGGRVTLSERPTQRSLPAAFFPDDVVATGRSSLPRSSVSPDLATAHKPVAHLSACSASAEVTDSGAQRASSSTMDSCAIGAAVAAQPERTGAAATQRGRRLAWAGDEAALARAIAMTSQQPGSSLRYTFDAADFDDGCSSGGSYFDGPDDDTLLVRDASSPPPPPPPGFLTRAESEPIRFRSPSPFELTVGEEWAAAGGQLDPDSADRRPRRSSKVFTFQYPSKWNRAR